MKRPHLPRSFHQQIVVLTATVTAVAMLLLTLVLQLVLARISSNDVDRVLEDRIATVVSSARSGPAGQLVVPDSQLDEGVAVYDGAGHLVAGRAPERLRSTYAELGKTSTSARRTIDGRSRVLAEPFATVDGVPGVVVVTERTGPYEEAERLALLVSLVTGLLTTIAAATIAALATRRALMPVTVMAETATDWSEHDLSKRFDQGPPHDEISALAGTLDTLLDRVSSAIRSEQRLTSELAHELRTPLTTIQGLADLVLLRDALPAEARGDVEEISAAAQRMAQTITTLIELARNEASVVAASHCSLSEVLAEATAGAERADISLTIEATDIVLDLPHPLAVRAVSPVVENALRLATSTVAISFAAATGWVDIQVDDDGPGINAGQFDLIFEPGTTSGNGSGAGLGLAIARRIARSVGGDVAVSPAASMTRFVIRLPRG